MVPHGANQTGNRFILTESNFTIYFSVTIVECLSLCQNVIGCTSNGKGNVEGRNIYRCIEGDIYRYIVGDIYIYIYILGDIYIYMV